MKTQGEHTEENIRAILSYMAKQMLFSYSEGVLRVKMPDGTIVGFNDVKEPEDYWNSVVIGRKTYDINLWRPESERFLAIYWVDENHPNGANTRTSVWARIKRGDF